MIVICEECGKNYLLDEKIMSTDRAKFVCKTCDNIITIIKPKEEEKKNITASPFIEEIQTTKEAVSAAVTVKKSGIKLLHKMLFLFLVVPGILILISGFLYYHQLNTLSVSLNTDSKNVVMNLSEIIIANTARLVGKSCKTYLDSHPELRPEEFNNENGEFQKIAMVNVGETGYTLLYERPNGADGAWPIWVHPNHKVVGIDMKTLEKQIPDFPAFWNIFGNNGLKNNKETKGYYSWMDADGLTRARFMVCTPIEGTNYIIAATTYMDEFAAPAREMEARSNATTKRIKIMVSGILAATLLIIAIIVSVYSKILSGKVRVLTDHAERISVGELDTDIDMASKDEIGDLAQAISRMQDSIRLSIERLRRRRQSV